MSGRERRYQQWLNHRISKAIVQQAKALNAMIAVEDLTGIRERTNELPRNKTERRRSNSWAFYQLRLLGRSVNAPGGSEYLCCSLSYDASGLLKAPRRLPLFWYSGKTRVNSKF